MTAEPTHNVFAIGSTSVRLLVPSRHKHGAILDADLRREWESRARRALETAPFGGATPSHVVGSFVHDDGRVTREDITVLTSICPTETLQDEAARTRILGLAGELCAALGQESVLVGWGDEGFVVSAVFDPTAIAVIRFSDLSPDAQARHVTMGWGGIHDPSMILQVLSLDGWRPSPLTAENTGWLIERASLKEGDQLRRAWSSEGDLDALKKAAIMRGDEGPRAGDLIFFRQRPGYIAFVLVGDRSLLGPRDLRESHGQLNPVTRQLLDRLLLRQWDELARDMRQKPLSQSFFPKLQSLQEKIQNHVTDAQPKKAKDPQAAFRYSVLIVGRMMFLRFLAQKRWVPGGNRAFREAFERARAANQPFFDHFIKPLWFGVLNVPENERRPEVVAVVPGEYPYLNGGLFQPRPGEETQSLPDDLFDPEVTGSFLSLFDNFEFSLNEYAGSDDSLRIDPSLFGQILETFNSKTEKKSEGVHYTPKAIARALALESILQRVAALTGLPREKLDDLAVGGRTLSGAEAEQVSEALNTLRIVDPAVGSGVLLWACLEVLLTLDSACEGLQSHGDGYRRGSRKWGKRSRHFVCNNLFGVDISDEAVELTRLRLWLAVALSEDAPQLLPDLELNVCRGDSLLPSIERAPAQRGGFGPNVELAFDDKTALENELAKLALEYARAGERNPVGQRELRARVLDIRRKLSQLGSEARPDALPFDWETYFPHVFHDASKQGFDVVIANPPYVRVQKQPPAQRGAYLHTWSSLARGNADLSFAFIELALRRLASPDGGQLAFIQPNFRHHDAGERVRGMLLGQAAGVSAVLRLWVDFDDAQVFPTATNYVTLLFAERREEATRQSTFLYSNPVAESWHDADQIDWLRPRGQTHEHPAEGDWLTVPKPLRDRVLDSRRRLPRTLGDYAEVSVGLQTSCDKLYLFEDWTELSGGIVQARPRGSTKPVKLERGLLRACRKGASSHSFHVFFPYDRSGQLLDELALAEGFPLGWKYLKRIRKTLEAREKGKFAGPGWYRFGRSQGILTCQAPKVLVPAVLRELAPVVDASGELAFTASGKGGGGAYALLPKGPRVSLRFLEAALRSPEAWDHIQAYGSPQQGGWRGIDAQVLAEIPCRDGGSGYGER